MKVIHTKDAQPQRGTTFTGTAVLERLLDAQREGGLSVSVVRFQDGARTYWHTHPGEQVLIILDGDGRVGTEEQEIEVHSGDVVYAAPGEKHWHGAMPGKDMAHISITTGGAPDWLGPVE